MFWANTYKPTLGLHKTSGEISGETHELTVPCDSSTKIQHPESSTVPSPLPKKLSQEKSTRKQRSPIKSTSFMQLATIALSFTGSCGGQRNSVSQRGSNRSQLADQAAFHAFKLDNQTNSFHSLQCPIHEESSRNIDIEKYEISIVTPDLYANPESIAFSDSCLSNISATPASTYPSAPGLEEAYAYLCLQDRSAYGYATELLRKMDTIVGKLQGFDSGDESQLVADHSKKLSQIGKSKNKADIKNIRDELSELENHLNGRYSLVYGKSTSEIGTSGRNFSRINEVITATHPSQGVELREKMALIYAIMKWLPQELQTRAGLETFESNAQLVEKETAMSAEERNIRVRRLKTFVDSLKLDFSIDVEQLSDFSEWRLISSTVYNFHYRQDVPGAPKARWTNIAYFKARPTRKRIPWVLHTEHENPRKVELAAWDPTLDDSQNQCATSDYHPKYQQTQTNKLTGSQYYVVREDRAWFKNNRVRENLITMTGPSGTSDVHIRLENIFKFTLAQKIAGLKARIAHMHLDRHHSLHEVLLATDGDPEVSKYLRYDGSLNALERLDPDLYHQAVEIRPQFMAREIELRNRLENERSAALKEAHFDACEWIKAEIETKLSVADQQELLQIFEKSKIVHKDSASGIRNLLDQFPVFNSAHAPVDRFEGVCASVLPPAPFMSTFNWQDKLFYGMLLNRNAVKPVLAGPQDLGSDCIYDEKRWDSTAGDSQRGQARWNGKPVSNAAGKHELCHDTAVTMQNLVSDIAQDGGGHKHLQQGKMVIHNELILGRAHNTSEPICEGIFVDLTSNDFMLAVARKKYRPLLRASEAVAVKDWLSALQAMNIGALNEQPEQFNQFKQLCIEKKLPFFVRAMSTSGEVEFHEIELSEVDSILEAVKKVEKVEYDANSLLIPFLKVVARNFQSH